MDGITFASKKYPSVFDYEEAKRRGSVEIVDEIQGSSNLVFDATVATTHGYKFEFEREVEKRHTARPMAFDEGYIAAGGKRTETVSCDTMRVGDARRFDELVADTTSDDGVAEREEAIKLMGQGIVTEKARCMLYGGLPADDGIVNGKEIPGLYQYVGKISNKQRMVETWEKGIYSPFIGENGYTIDNQDGAEYTTANLIDNKKIENVWTSILGVSWGKNGVFTTFPKYSKGKGGAYNIRIKPSNSSPYVDPLDGIERMAWDDWVIGDAYFGLGVKNRFCISGLRNIYLGHVKKADIEDEMYRVQQNLIAMKRFFDMGKTGTTMQFYCSAFLLDQMEMFMKGRVEYIATSPNQNDGSYGKLHTGRLRIADGIELISDFAFKTTESFVTNREA